jgi:hypothetical protein
MNYVAMIYIWSPIYNFDRLLLLLMSTGYIEESDSTACPQLSPAVPSCPQLSGQVGAQAFIPSATYLARIILAGLFLVSQKCDS